MSRLSNSAKGAEYESEGQARSASPLVTKTPDALRPEGPKYFALSGLGSFLILGSRGDALRACPWLSYSAPLALAPLREKYF
jgi:hypothetical protein